MLTTTTTPTTTHFKSSYIPAVASFFQRVSTYQEKEGNLMPLLSKAPQE
jgi:hypothetical protein